MRLPSPTLFGSILVLLGALACSDPSSPEEPNLLGAAPHPQADSINEWFSNLPRWVTGTPMQQDAKPQPPTYYVVVDGKGDRYDYRCDVMRKNLVKEFPKISVGTTNAELWPGAILRGNSVRDGDPQPIRLDRRPLRLTINLALDTTTKIVEDPNKSTVQQAIAELQHRADTQVGNIEVLPANVSFDVQEASSIDQAMLAVGVGGNYKEAFKGDLHDSVTNNVTSRTVVAMLRQELFTVTFDAGNAQPAALFDDEVTMADVRSAEGHDVMSSKNLPVYIKSVTYGRLVSFKMTSDSVSSFDQLTGAVSGTYDKFTGHGDISSEHRRVLANVRTTFLQRGGTQASAQQALNELDWHKFFTPSNASTAVPISFEARTLHTDADEVAKIWDSVTYDELGDCQAPIGYTVTIRWNSISPTAGACHVPYWFYAKAGVGLFLHSLSLLDGWGNLTGTRQVGHSLEVEVPQTETRPLTLKSETWPPYVAPAPWGIKSSDFSYPFNAIERGKSNPVHQIVDFSLCPARFDYSLSKVPMY